MSESRPKKRKIEFIESYWTGGELGSDYQWNDNHGELIRCKDCKHRPKYPEAYGAEIDGKWCYWCELNRAWEPDDWFCAAGKRTDKELTSKTSGTFCTGKQRMRMAQQH